MSNLKNIHIVDSYKIWKPKRIKKIIRKETYDLYKDLFADRVLNRNYYSMVFEWWLHNIGYYLTLPFMKLGINWIRDINLRCKHVDLEEWK